MDLGVSADTIGRSDDSSVTVLKVFLPILTTFLIVFPLALIKSFSKANYLSLASLVSLTLCLVIVIVEMPLYVVNYYPILNEEESKINSVNTSF